MRIIIALFIIGQGPAAFIGAILSWRMRTEDGEWPVLSKVACLWLIGVAIVSFGTLWNGISHGKGMIIPPDYLKWAFGISAAGALFTWAAVILFALVIINGKARKVVSRVLKFLRLNRRTSCL